MKKITLIIFLLAASFMLFAQEKPDWVDARSRESKYPSEHYFTGFVYRIVEKSVAEETQRATTDAQTELTKKIRAQVTAKTQNRIEAESKNGKYSEAESFSNQAKIESSAEIVGMKFVSHYSAKENMVYAFAYVNKYELIGYYKSNLSININQIESYVKTAQDLENQKEKAKARLQLENAKPLFPKVRYAQDMLTAIDPNASADDLQQTKTESLYNKLTQMQARLAQGVYILVESSEDLFGERVDIATDIIKGELSLNGCSFTGVEEHADFVLTIKITTRMVGAAGSMITCAADAKVELFDMYKQKNVYEDRISNTGSSKSQEKAGRFAINNVAPLIVEKLLRWVKN